MIDATRRWIAGLRWPDGLRLLLVLIVGAAAFFYRFNTLGGSYGGFTNDEFGYLARARQIQAGEVPFRDFNDPGWFLTDYAAAAAQWIGGYTLRSEALLTVGMLAVGVAVTFALARHAAGSVLAALLATAIHIALDARHYNYPKIVLYALAIWFAWAYADRPSAGRAAALGGLAGVGFLFRHDHLVYLGAFTLMTLAAVHGRRLTDGLRGAAVASLAAAAFVVPFLVFLAVNGGVTEYFRAALVYVSRDAERTSFSLPRLSFDSSRPLVAIGRDQMEAARVNVRWTTVAEGERQAAEARYGLADGTRVDDRTWTYTLADTTSDNIEALVRDPRVADTHGVDRSAFRVAAGEPLRLQTQLDTVANATAFLYYLFVALPLVAAALLWRLRRASGSTIVLRDPAYLVPLIGLAAMLNVGFMSRGSTNIRIADVGVTATILLAWIIAVLATRDGVIAVPPRTGRAAARAALVAVLCLTVLSANGLAQGARTARDAGFTAGPVEVLARARRVWDRLGVDPPALAAEPEQPAILRVAAYIRECTQPDDRLFVLGEYPALYYFADRRFAGGHAWLLPHYYTDEANERRILERLARSRVPVVVTEDERTYDEDYRPVFEHVDRHLRAEYMEAGTVDIGNARALRILVRRELEPRRRHEPDGLPCFR